MANDNTIFQLEVITPDQMFYTGGIQMVEFNTQEGLIGILKDHSALTTILAPGTLTISIGTEKKKGALMSGFAEILPHRVRILAEAAEWPEDIDKARAKAAKERAEKRLNSQEPDIDIERAEFALSRALVRLDVAKE
jgi:F-type H+-transporting ATPase subunit epsilon